VNTISPQISLRTGVYHLPAVEQELDQWTAQMFERLVHADWSVNDSKRWMAIAEHAPGGWRVAAPRRVLRPTELVEGLLFDGGTVLAGFDFPIGIPAAFGRKTGFDSFPEALTEFGRGEWGSFFVVADRPEDISLRRPFYPNRSVLGCRQDHLLRALGVDTMDELLRVCERKTQDRRAACPIFWTLGANQVGKAAIDGWQSVVRPALLRGACLWPFAGSLGELSRSSACVLCETYPQEAYSHVGVRFRSGGSKQNQDDRGSAGAQMLAFAEYHGVVLADDARSAALEGFGRSKSGEDPFDALVGVLSMIAVVDGKRAAGGTSAGHGGAWEGWILGQQA
jgi:hypothetical protein